MRQVTASIENAIANLHGVSPLTKVEVFPSRIFFSVLTRNNAIPNADGLPVGDDPMCQEIGFGNELVTFIADSQLKYAVDGNNTPVTTSYPSSKKPGVYGNTIFIVESTTCKRCAIDWDKISNLENSPFTLQETLTPTDTPLVAHAISDTDCVLLCDGDGGFSISYYADTTEILSPARFMFPHIAEWENSDRSMGSLGIFSTAFQLGDRIFVYMSNAATGIIQGIFYDLNSQVWSDIYTALPTDLSVSLCEFRISNSFVRNNKAYIVGQFIRTDIFESALPYTLIISTEDGKNFSIDRFTLVSNLGYRFLGLVGSDNKLYLASCNRVCEADSTWVFDGLDDSLSPRTTFLMEGLLSTDDANAENMSFTLPTGDETIFDNPHLVETSRVKLYAGYQTTDGDEYILYGTYIVQNINTSYANGSRQFKLTGINEAQWKLSGLSMPFYAEIFGLSSIYDPMTEASGKLYTATSGYRIKTKFSLDFWQQEGYTNTDAGISPVNMIVSGGVSGGNNTGAHKQGIITTGELKDIIQSALNPKIMATSITAKVYGWSYPPSAGMPGDIINVVLVTCDKDGKNEETTITADTQTWPVTWPWESPGALPIVLTISGLTIGRFIKKVGVVFEQSSETKFNIGRIDFTDNLEVAYTLSLGNTGWSAESDGTFKVPGSGQPFIMFAQKPYNAFNFTLTSLFENTITGGITGYPVAVGLVGLAEDANNYVLARFDKVKNRVQLVKCRGGIETILVEQAPGWTVGDLQGMQFAHRDGHFSIYLYRQSTTQYELSLEYDWKDSDGFMCTSMIVTKKCGIYGAIMAPYVRILAYQGGTQDDVTAVDGLAIDPIDDLTDFPSSGNFRIGESIYSYTGKISHPSVIDGPYQLRTIGDSYPAPYGNGKAGLECRYFDWTAPNDRYTGKFIAISNGSVFISAGSLWHIFIKTGGQVQWIYGRSRHYSDNTMIGRMSTSLADRVWPGVGGFTGVSLTSGIGGRQPLGEHAILELTGYIKCYWFMGTGGEHDTTIKDLITSTAGYCGAKVTFPGDYIQAELSVDGETSIFSDDYSEGYDISFELAAPTSFEIRTNVKIKPDNYEQKEDILNDTGTTLIFSSLGSGNFSIALVSTPSATQMFKFTYTSGSARQYFRVLYHESNISIYHNHKWVTSITLDELVYTQTNAIDIKAYTAAPVTFENVNVIDLSDWREAVYIDLETDGTAAIGSIIQERPIQMGTNPDGGLYFYYEMARPELTLLVDPINHSIDKTIPNDGSSDAIVYGSKDVKTLHSDIFAEKYGFSTRLFRLPNLNVGAVEAAYRMLKKAYENQEKHSLSIRPDYRIMVGDVLHIVYSIANSNLIISHSIIVEGTNFSLKEVGKKVSSTMRVNGRKYLP